LFYFHRRLELATVTPRGWNAILAQDRPFRMGEVLPMVSVRTRWVLTAVVLVALLVVAGWQVFLRDKGTIGSNGGEVWSADGTVGVVVPIGAAPKPTHVTFTPTQDATAPAPLSALSAVVRPAVNISFDKRVSSAEVAFAFNQAAVPADAAQPGQPMPTIHNAGIEVFNEDIGAWIPLPTIVDEARNQIRAVAPHFSLFRAVVSKVGSFAVKVRDKLVEVTLDAAKSLWDTFYELTVGTLKVIFRDLTATFDESKYRCEPLDGSYRIDFHSDVIGPLGLGKFAACMIAGRDGDRMLIKNGTAVPFSFTANGAAGVKPTLQDNADADVVAMAQSFAGTLLGRALAPGLDTAGFLVGDDAPSTFEVDGSVSWVAVAIDLTIALVTVFLPESRAATVSYRTVLAAAMKKMPVKLAKDTAAAATSGSGPAREAVEETIEETHASPTIADQATLVLDAIDCATIAANSISEVRDWAAVANAVVGIARKCLSLATAKMRSSELKDLVATIHEIADITKVVPEVGQLATMGGLALFGRNATNVTFTVHRENLAPATKVVTLAGMTASGEPVPGFTVEPGGAEVDNCEVAAAAADAGIVSCGPNAADADVCWVRPDRVSLLCGGMPWLKDLHQRTAKSAVGKTAAKPEPMPWGLELSNGLRCRLRNGGAWGGRSDGYAGAYECFKDGTVPNDDTVSNDVVLTREGQSLIDRTKPVWTVLVGPIGNPDEVFPPPTSVDVATVYLAGSAGVDK